MKNVAKWVMRVAIAILTCLFIFILIYFPSGQAPLAFTLGTGIGIVELQERVNGLENRPIAEKVRSGEDRVFLKNLYTCFAKGGRLVFVLRTTASMMERYLSCEGTLLQIDASTFRENGNVQTMMKRLRSQIDADKRAGRTLQAVYISPRFYMPDDSSPDSRFGL